MDIIDVFEAVVPCVLMEKWKVYNLIGTGGVVVSIANRPYLAMKVG